MDTTSGDSQMIERLVSLTNAAAHDAAAAAQISQIENDWLAAADDDEGEIAWERAVESWSSGCHLAESVALDVYDGTGRYAGWVEPVGGAGWIAHVLIEDEFGREHRPLRALHASVDEAARALVGATGRS